MAGSSKDVGIAIVGCGTIGRIRAMIAKDYPGVKWIGLCDWNERILNKLAEDCNADFKTADVRELVKRPEVDAVIIATEEGQHVDPVMASIEAGIKFLFIEKPLATDAKESLKILEAIEKEKIDAVIGYTNRFRRRFLTVKERLINGQVGEVSTVITRALMNRMVPIATCRKTKDTKSLTPMVISGTHSFDMSMWLMEGKIPVSMYAQSVTKALGKYGTKDSTVGIFTMDDGTIFNMSISWALPVVWPGAVYGLEIGIVGDKGVIDIEDTHRDLVMATEFPQSAGYKPDGYEPDFARHVEFLTSYPPGDVWQGQIWGPIREETTSWFAHLCNGLKTPHATAFDGHRNLVLTKCMDLASDKGTVLQIPKNIKDFDLDLLD